MAYKAAVDALVELCAYSPEEVTATSVLGIIEAHLPMSPRDRGRVGAAASWRNTSDRSARTAPARAALDARFLRAAGGDIEKAAALRAAHFANMAARSAAVRRQRKAIR